MTKPLNLFYEEPDPDRWFKYDHYPRRILRHLLRGKQVNSGQFMVYFNLVKGLTKAGIPFRLNDYKYIKKKTDEIACIIGKDFLLDKIAWNCPIVYGPSFGINPISDPQIMNNYPIKKLIVPGKWVKELFSPYGSENIEVWPVGIDSDYWQPTNQIKQIDFLIYNKIRWFHQKMDSELVNPIKNILNAKGKTFVEIKYGHYKPLQLKQALEKCKMVIFLCEHETQGIAYQQILSSGTPILAWDRGGYWEDPNWYPDKIKFKSVSSVPYWNEYCGVKFDSILKFEEKLTEFLDLFASNFFQPREYILQNLTLEKSAINYFDIISSIQI